MRISSAAAASAVLVAAGVDAFAPSPNFKQRQATTRLSLLPDPIAVTSAVESSSVVTSAVMESLGSLALLGSVGFGIAYSNVQNKDWSYEYKIGNEYSEGAQDLALLEEDPESISEKVSSFCVPWQHVRKDSSRSTRLVSRFMMECPLIAYQ